ncbi:AlpA family transcriptional regulator [Noviherbaspirillum sp.]|jgi:prophage regulatory protein|uniref:helix-turn-helix transcriptional regulator n=1 Tax=Noviherbaspirillum sp. TaxID=1926288 RepID=UPI0025F747BB|nr:AlpA family transcriptional regulator [Noviherbaspirillum sp.]
METESASRQEIRFMRLPEVLALCGKSRSSIYAAIKKGEFPAPVKLSTRSSAWIRSEITAWAESRVMASRTEKR